MVDALHYISRSLEASLDGDALAARDQVKVALVPGVSGVRGWRRLIGWGRFYDRLGSWYLLLRRGVRRGEARTRRKVWARWCRDCGQAGGE